MLNIVEDLDVNLDVEDLQEIKIVHMQKNIIDYTEDMEVLQENIMAITENTMDIIEDTCIITEDIGEEATTIELEDT